MIFFLMMTFEFLSKYQYYGKLPSVSVIFKSPNNSRFFSEYMGSDIINTFDILKILYSFSDIDTNHVENLT